MQSWYTVERLDKQHGWDVVGYYGESQARAEARRIRIEEGCVARARVTTRPPRAIGRALRK